MLKLLLGLLGAVVVVASSRLLGWRIGYLAIILFLFWMVQQTPPKLRRRMFLAYFVFVIALLSSTFIHTMWVRSGSVQRALQRISILRLLAGDTIRLGFWAFILGLVIGIATVWAALQALLYISSEFVLNLLTGLKITRQEAMRYLLDLVLQRQSPSIIVDDGQIATETPAGLVSRLGGPGILIVRAGNALILESVDGASRIVGPGTTPIKRFEKIKKVVDLRPQQESVTVKDVLTKDRVPLAFQVNVSYQIESKADTDVRPAALTESKHFEGVINGTYPVYQESVFKAVYNVAKEGWQKETTGALASVLRDVVFEYNLDELYDYPVTALAESRYVGGKLKPKTLVISTIEEAVQARLSAAAIVWGVKVNRVDVATVEMPAEIRQMVLAWWQKKWETEIAKQDADKEVKVLLQRAAGRRDAMIFESEGEAIAKAEWLRHMLQVLLKDSQQLDAKSAVELLVQLLAQESVTKALAGGQLSLPKPEQAKSSPEGEGDRAQEQPGTGQDQSKPSPDSPTAKEPQNPPLTTSEEA